MKNSFLVFQTFKSCEPLAAAPKVIKGGDPYRVSTWVDSAENNAVLMRID